MEFRGGVFTIFFARRAQNGGMRTKRISCLLALAALATACRGPVELASERPIAAVAPDPATPASPVGPSGSATTTPAPSYRGAAATPSGVVVPVVGHSTRGSVVGTPCGRTVSVGT